VELDFEVRPPPIGREQAAERVRQKIAAEGLRCERLDLSDEPVDRRALFDMSGARVPFPFPEDPAYDRCYVALVDPDVGLGWAHEAHWAFVPADGEGEVVLQDTKLPEHMLGPVRLFPVRRS
jgi:hypothetical protein